MQFDEFMGHVQSICYVEDVQVLNFYPTSTYLIDLGENVIVYFNQVCII